MLYSRLFCYDPSCENGDRKVRRLSCPPKFKIFFR